MKIGRTVNNHRNSFRNSANPTHCINKKKGCVVHCLEAVLLTAENGVSRRAEIIYLFCMQLY